MSAVVRCTETGGDSLLNSILVVSQPCCRPMTYAMVWLPLAVGRVSIHVGLSRGRKCGHLPSLEIPIVVPRRSVIELYFEFLPVITALSMSIRPAEIPVSTGNFTYQFKGAVT